MERGGGGYPEKQEMKVRGDVVGWCVCVCIS